MKNPYKLNKNEAIDGKLTLHTYKLKQVQHIITKP